MARPLRVLSLLSRLGALSLMKPPVSVHGCRFASSKARAGQSRVHGQRSSAAAGEDALGLQDLEEVEDKLQALENEERKRQKTVKYHILRRQMTPPGAPQRKLTWDAIEQIRYLKRELPEEWTVQRLAEGYSVTTDVILRVLRSKFVPPTDRKTQQDVKVMVRLGEQALPSGAGTGRDRAKLPGNRTPAVLLPGSSGGGAVVPVADGTVMLRGDGSRALAKRPAPDALLPSHFRAGISEVVPVTRSREEDSTSNTNPTEDEEDEEDEDSWDGQLLTEEELEEFIHMEKPHPAVQVGNDFFDVEGNFLYRI